MNSSRHQAAHEMAGLHAQPRHFFMLLRTLQPNGMDSKGEPNAVLNIELPGYPR